MIFKSHILLVVQSSCDFTHFKYPKPRNSAWQVVAYSSSSHPVATGSNQLGPWAHFMQQSKFGWVMWLHVVVQTRHIFVLEYIKWLRGAWMVRANTNNICDWSKEFPVLKRWVASWDKYVHPKIGKGLRRRWNGKPSLEVQAQCYSPAHTP